MRGFCQVVKGEVPQQWSLPFFGDLHDERTRSWSKPYLFLNFFYIVDSKAQGYILLPQVEVMLASYLSPGGASSLGESTLPTTLCRATSTLVGRAFHAACQAGVALYTTMVLQSNQTALHKYLSAGREEAPGSFQLVSPPPCSSVWAVSHPVPNTAQLL